MEVRLMKGTNSLLLKPLSLILTIGCSLAVLFSCSNNEESLSEVGFTEKESVTVTYSNCQVEYLGDISGEASSDCWVIMLSSDMSSNEDGTLVGPGSVMQLMLNATYEEGQTPQLENLVGNYFSQSNSGDFRAETFIYGYMDHVNTPNGRVERAAATYYGELGSGQSEEQMSIDLLDSGSIVITANDDDTYTIEGILIGKKCLKRYFSWRGTIEPTTQVEEGVKNSTIMSNVTLEHLTQGVIEDRGDYFYLKDESYRDFVVLLADQSVDLSSGRPQGSGDVLRIEVLVPWDTNVEEGVPAGVYTMVSRNEDTSIDRSAIVPFSAVPGLPNRFSYPYWSGTWYVKYNNGEWSNSYARLDLGTVSINRGDDGSHHIVCSFGDCATPSHQVACDVVIANDKMIVK